MEAGQTASLAADATTNLGLIMPRNSQPIPSTLLDPRSESLPSPPPPDPAWANRLDGVIVLVSTGDVYLAKACCASIRQSLGDIPITLLVDGLNTDTVELQRLPNVSRMTAQELAGEEYGPLWSGFWVKLLIFWKSPYERFLYLDADTLVWGDVRAYAELDKYDFIAGLHFQNPQTFQTSEEIQKFVYDVGFIKKLDPALDWRGQALANNGAFFARRQVFSKEKLQELRQLSCWRCYEQGVINYLRWQATRTGTPRVTGCELQLFPAEAKYDPADRFFPRANQRPAIIHWICKKPKLGRRYQAADDYRRLFLKMTGRTRWLTARLFAEDIFVWFSRQRRSLNKKNVSHKT